MTDRTTPVNLGAKLFLPFLVADLLLLAAAYVVWQQAQRPMTAYEVGAFAGCVALGAWLSVWPFRLRHEAEIKLAETAALTDTLAQIGRVEEVADRIDNATGRWHTVQDSAGQTMTAAREILDRMTAEQREFRSFMQKAEDTERNHLRLEVNKLRRAEGDWLQVLVRILDQVYALYQAGVRSGQPHLIEQFTQFQNACRDAARRVGMVPLVAAPDSPFDAELHQLPDPKATPPSGAVVAETLATGHAFQGQLLRRAVVVLRPPTASLPTTPTVESFSTRPPAATSAPTPPASPRPDEVNSGTPNASLEQPEGPPAAADAPSHPSRADQPAGPDPGESLPGDDTGLQSGRASAAASDADDVRDAALVDSSPSPSPMPSDGARNERESPAPGPDPAAADDASATGRGKPPTAGGSPDPRMPEPSHRRSAQPELLL